jgi:hypothetical protein
LADSTGHVLDNDRIKTAVGADHLLAEAKMLRIGDIRLANRKPKDRKP